MNINIFNVIKHLTVLSIVGLIIGCIYYLVTAVQVFQQLYEQLDRAERLEGNTSGAPMLTRQAKNLLERHETLLTYQIIVCSSTSALSLLGLMGTVRQCLPLILIYATIVKLIFIASFFLPSKLKPWLIVWMALVSILSYSFGYLIRRQRTSASHVVNLPEVYFNKNRVNYDIDDNELRK